MIFGFELGIISFNASAAKSALISLLTMMNMQQHESVPLQVHEYWSQFDWQCKA